MSTEDDWDSIAFLRRCNRHYRKALEVIERREFKLTISDEDVQLDLDDILKEEEYNAMAEIIDSFIRAEIVRNDFGIFKIEQRMGGLDHGRQLYNKQKRMGRSEESSQQ